MKKNLMGLALLLCACSLQGMEKGKQKKFPSDQNIQKTIFAKLDALEQRKSIDRIRRENAAKLFTDNILNIIFENGFNTGEKIELKANLKELKITDVSRNKDFRRFYQLAQGTMVHLDDLVTKGVVSKKVEEVIFPRQLCHLGALSLLVGRIAADKADEEILESMFEHYVVDPLTWIHDHTIPKGHKTKLKKAESLEKTFVVAEVPKAKLKKIMAPSNQQKNPLAEGLE